ncbi:MAG TPA: TauD/TfdA family dioxygenase [Candidatus Sulfotelmatobacter sp.]|nr:TauD/TfdA family dioxygenase [Candidatus Sulfotelmatobacter sp.]
MPDKITVKPIAGALGAEIDGVDLARPLDNASFAAVHQALLDHLVIFFHDQHLTQEQHLAFGQRFGTLNVHDFVEGMREHREIIEVRKEPAETQNFGNGWHTDVSYLEKPALGSILYAREVPDHGGDTMFANMYLAYESLSDGMRRLLDGLKAVHSGARFYGPNSSFYRENRSMKMLYSPDAELETEHPVVRTHPETGRKGLYVNSGFTTRFAGMTVEESAPLLKFLFDHAARPEFTCRFHWRPNAIAFWDNRSVQHYAINDYHGQRRVMQRVTVDGDRPF